VLAAWFDLSAKLDQRQYSDLQKVRTHGEGPFVKDMVNQIYSASMAGQISVNDTPQSIFNRIVLAVDQFVRLWTDDGFNAELINTTILGIGGRIYRRLANALVFPRRRLWLWEPTPLRAPRRVRRPYRLRHTLSTVTAPTQSVVPADQFAIATVHGGYGADSGDRRCM